MIKHSQLEKKNFLFLIFFFLRKTPPNDSSLKTKKPED